MSLLPQSIKDLIDEFAKLPGIGPKTAARLTFYLLKQPDQELERFGETLQNLKQKINLCPTCFTLVQNNFCPFCDNVNRDSDLICIVEEPLDIIALEKTKEYRGLYHVLHGIISPMDGIGPEHLKIPELISRIKKNKPKEIIIATNPSLEGEATAMYLQRILKDFKIKLTRLGRGLPTGGELEYADEITLVNALQGRREIKL
ncbi:MAG: recombination mediator RecR [Patescibacteria group bacterium]|nr:recombination mediator RecR [Patescibacteria group bacterium]